MQKVLPPCLPVVGAPTPESSSTPLCALSPRFSLGVKGRGDPQGYSGSQATEGWERGGGTGSWTISGENVSRVSRYLPKYTQEWS